MNFQMFKLVLEKAEEPEIKLLTFIGSSEKQESYKKKTQKNHTSISALFTMSKPLTVWITINWKILKELGISDHLTCFLRKPYPSQKATIRTLGGMTGSKLGKGYDKAVYCHPAYLTSMQSTS